MSENAGADIQALLDAVKIGEQIASLIGGPIASLFQGVPHEAKTTGTGYVLLHSHDPILQYEGAEILAGAQAGRVISESNPPQFESEIGMLISGLVTLSNDVPSGDLWATAPAELAAHNAGTTLFYPSTKPLPPPVGAPYSEPTGGAALRLPNNIPDPNYQRDFGHQPPTRDQLIQFLQSGKAPTYDDPVVRQAAIDKNPYPVIGLWSKQYKDWLTLQAAQAAQPTTPPPTGQGGTSNDFQSALMYWCEQCFKPELAQPVQQFVKVAVTFIDALNLTEISATTSTIITILRSFSTGEKPLAQSAADLLKCLCPDLEDIAKAIREQTASQDVPQSILDQLTREGAFSPELAQLIGGSPVAWGLIGIIWSIAKFVSGHKLDTESWWVNFFMKVKDQAPTDIRHWVSLLYETISSDLPAFASAHIGIVGPPLAEIISTLASLETDIPKLIFEAVTRFITPLTEVTPENVEDVGFALEGAAFLVGQGLHLARGFAELLHYPMSSIWDHNAELIVDLLGYKEIIGSFHRPFFNAAISEAARQKFARQFRPFIPSESLGFQMYARRKIEQPQLTSLVELNGVRKEWVDPLLAIAYRPVSPFILAAGFTNADIPEKPLRDSIQNNGYSPSDVKLTETVVKVRSLESVRNSLISKVASAVAEGIRPMADLTKAMTDSEWGSEAQHLKTQEVLNDQMVALAKTVEREVIELLAAGGLTPAQATSQLSAAGIQPDRVKLLVELGTTKADVKRLRKEESQQERDLHRAQRLAAETAIDSYHRGTIDAAAMTAAVEASGLPAVETTPLIARAIADAQARNVFAYGKTLSRNDAETLRLRIAALREGVEKEDTDPTFAQQQLELLGVPAGMAAALVDEWVEAGGKKGTSPLGPGQPQFK